MSPYFCAELLNSTDTLSFQSLDDYVTKLIQCRTTLSVSFLRVLWSRGVYYFCDALFGSGQFLNP